jgi:hypothetical protein
VEQEKRKNMKKSKQLVKIENINNKKYITFDEMNTLRQEITRKTALIISRKKLDKKIFLKYFNIQDTNVYYYNKETNTNIFVQSLEIEKRKQNINEWLADEISFFKFNFILCALVESIQQDIQDH